jgi:hypothetical protein
MTVGECAASYRSQNNRSSLLRSEAVNRGLARGRQFSQNSTNPNAEGFMRKLMLGLAAVSLTMPVMDSPAFAARYHYNGKVWKDSHGRWRCKRSNGTTGLIVGAAGGALVGRAIDTHGVRATGTILGAVGGAIIGR